MDWKRIGQYSAAQLGRHTIELGISGMPRARWVARRETCSMQLAASIKAAAAAREGLAARDVARSMRDNACRKHAACATTRSVQRSACCVRDRPAPPLFPLPSMRNVVSCRMAWDYHAAWDTARKRPVFLPLGLPLHWQHMHAAHSGTCGCGF